MAANVLEEQPEKLSVDFPLTFAGNFGNADPEDPIFEVSDPQNHSRYDFGTKQILRNIHVYMPK